MVVLVNSTNVMELGQLETIPGVDACLIAGLSGSGAASVIPSVLWGEKEPSGRTADTWVYDLTTAASYANAGLEAWVLTPMPRGSTRQTAPPAATSMHLCL